MRACGMDLEREEGTMEPEWSVISASKLGRSPGATPHLPMPPRAEWPSRTIALKAYRIGIVRWWFPGAAIIDGASFQRRSASSGEARAKSTRTFFFQNADGEYSHP